MHQLQTITNVKLSVFFSVPKGGVWLYFFLSGVFHIFILHYSLNSPLIREAVAHLLTPPESLTQNSEVVKTDLREDPENQVLLTGRI